MKNFMIAFQFLTRFTIISKKMEVTREKLANSMIYFPLVGLLIGSFLVIINFMGGLFLPPLVVDSLIIISLISITRGLHLDGFADTLDGFMGGKTKEEVLYIMSDSRIGAMGAIGIFCLLLAKLSLIYEMPIEIKNIALLLMPVLGRWTIVLASASSNYAKEENGLGRPFTDYVTTKEFALATITTVLIGWGVFSFEGWHYKGIVLILIIYLVNLSLLRFIKKKIGGVTGDVLGAICEVNEVLVLLFIMIIQEIESKFFSQL